MIKAFDLVLPPIKAYNKGILQDIKTFDKSDSINCQIDCSGYQSAKACYNSYYNTAKKYFSGKIAVRISGDNVYLVKMEDK